MPKMALTPPDPQLASTKHGWNQLPVGQARQKASGRHKPCNDVDEECGMLRSGDSSDLVWGISQKKGHLTSNNGECNRM